MKNRVLLSLCLLGCLTGCGQSSKDHHFSYTNTRITHTAPEQSGNIKGAFSYYVSENNCPSVEYALNFDYSDLVTFDNKEYHKDFAKLAILLSSDIGASYWGQMKDKSGNYGDAKQLKNLLGFEDMLYSDLYNKTYEHYVDDLLKATVAHHQFNYQGQNREAVFIAISGTASDREWHSNFDPGYDGENFDRYSDWERLENHKGYDVAVSRFMPFFENYMDTYIELENPIIFLSGYSRGAGCANILGKLLEEANEYKTFTYTMATPNTTTDENAKSYKTIFNLINQNDVVTQVLKHQGFTHYGTDVILNPDKRFADIYKTTIRDPYSSEENEYTKWKYWDNGIKRIAQNREDLFKLQVMGSADFETEEECISFRNDVLETINTYDLNKMFDVGEIKYVRSLKDQSKMIYAFQMKCAPMGAIGYIFEYFMNNGLSLDNIEPLLTQVKMFGTLGVAVIDLLPLVLNNAIVTNHVSCTYYLLVRCGYDGR